MSKVQVTFHTMTGPEVYVVKRDGMYLRVPNAGALLFCVRSVRLATRFDSRLWAASWVALCGPDKKGRLGKVVRLVTKTERAARKEGVSAFTWRAEEKTDNASPPETRTEGKP